MEENKNINTNWNSERWNNELHIVLLSEKKNDEEEEEEKKNKKKNYRV